MRCCFVRFGDVTDQQFCRFDLFILSCVRLCPTMSESVLLGWNLSNYVGICPTTLESVSCYSLGTIREYVLLSWNLSNYIGICIMLFPRDIILWGHYSLGTTSESVQLSWNLSNYIRNCPITLESISCYSLGTTP